MPTFPTNADDPHIPPQPFGPDSKADPHRRIHAPTGEPCSIIQVMSDKTYAEVIFPNLRRFVVPLDDLHLVETDDSFRIWVMSEYYEPHEEPNISIWDSEERAKEAKQFLIDEGYFDDQAGGKIEIEPFQVGNAFWMEEWKQSQHDLYRTEEE